MKNYIWGIVGVIVIVLIVVLANKHKSAAPADTTTAPAATSTTTATSTTNPTTTMNDTTPAAATTTTADGLQITVVQQGTGVGAANGDTVTVNYTGSLTDGTVFDSNVDPKFAHVSPFSFQLGAGMVIKGWDEGVLGMKVGEERKLVIPAALGYGSTGQGPIPGNATLDFDVTVTGISHS